MNDKQQAFVEHYLICRNASKAARLAGYSDKTAGQQGYRLLKTPAVREALRIRMGELAMSAEEVLYRLTEQAESSMADFLSITLGKAPSIDLGKAMEAGKLHLIKKITFDKFGNVAGIELHDAQSALVQLGRYHKLFVDRFELDWRRELEEAGVDAGEAFQQLVNALAANINSGDAGHDGGGRPGR